MDDKLFLQALRRRPESNLRKSTKKYGRRKRSGSGPNRTPHFRKELRDERKTVRQRTEMPPIIAARELIAEHMSPTSNVTMSLLQEAHRLNELGKLGALVGPLTNLPEDPKEYGNLTSRILCYINDIGSEKVERLIDDRRWVGEVERLCFEFRAEAETMALPMTEESAL